MGINNFILHLLIFLTGEKIISFARTEECSEAYLKCLWGKDSVTIKFKSFGRAHWEDVLDMIEVWKRQDPKIRCEVKSCDERFDKILKGVIHSKIQSKNTINRSYFSYTVHSYSIYKKEKFNAEETNIFRADIDTKISSRRNRPRIKEIITRWDVSKRKTMFNPFNHTNALMYKSRNFINHRDTIPNISILDRMKRTIHRRHVKCISKDARRRHIAVCTELQKRFLHLHPDDPHCRYEDIPPACPKDPCALCPDEEEEPLPPPPPPPPKRKPQFPNFDKFPKRCRPKKFRKSTVSCVKSHNKVACKQHCGFGYGIESGGKTVIERDFTCRVKDGQWSPSDMTDCKPYLNCNIKLRKGAKGSIQCKQSSCDSPPVCDIKCGSRGKYIRCVCSTRMKLPECARLETPHEQFIPPPKNMPSYDQMEPEEPEDWGHWDSSEDLAPAPVEDSAEEEPEEEEPEEEEPAPPPEEEPAPPPEEEPAPLPEEEPAPPPEREPKPHEHIHHHEHQVHVKVNVSSHSKSKTRSKRNLQMI